MFSLCSSCWLKVSRAIRLAQIALMIGARAASPLWSCRAIVCSACQVTRRIRSASSCRQPPLDKVLWLASVCRFLWKALSAAVLASQMASSLTNCLVKEALP